MLIIKSLMVNSYRVYSKHDADSLKLKTLCRFRQNLKKSKARLKIQLAGYINLVFPELEKFFNSGIHIAASYALLKKYSSPAEIAALTRPSANPGSLPQNLPVCQSVALHCSATRLSILHGSLPLLTPPSKPNTTLNVLRVLIIMALSVMSLISLLV